MSCNEAHFRGLERMYLEGANTTQREAAGLPIMAFNPDGEPVDIVNHYVNFGWEYVYHCHILSHEEMDMMHAQVVGVDPSAPSDPTWVLTGNGNNKTNVLTWTDNSLNESGFKVERRVSVGGTFQTAAMLEANVATMTRPSRPSMMSWKASPTVRSDGV